MLQKSGRLVLWEAMFILELHSAETQDGRLPTYILFAWVVKTFINLKISTFFQIGFF